MKKKLVLFALFIAVLALAFWAFRTRGQAGWTIVSSNGAPSGSCNAFQVDVDTVTGNVWSCPSGIWILRTGAQPISCTTGSIGGSLLAVGTSANGTASCTGATTSMVCQAQASDGTNMAALGASPMCTVTSSGVATVNLVAIVALTPAAKTYSVRVFP